MKDMRAKFIAGALCVMTGAASAQQMAFGTDAEQAYAADIWQAMAAAGLAGEGAIQVFPYAGVEPHGMMLQTFYARATIDGHDGDLIIKRNFGPEGVSAAQVLADPDGHLGAVTVMFRRESGYDAENGNWFWAKYLPDGSLDAAPDGTALAGRASGCIACHGGAGGGDMLFTND